VNGINIVDAHGVFLW